MSYVLIGCMCCVYFNVCYVSIFVTRRERERERHGEKRERYAAHIAWQQARVDAAVPQEGAFVDTRARGAGRPPPVEHRLPGGVA